MRLVVEDHAALVAVASCFAKSMRQFTDIAQLVANSAVAASLRKCTARAASTLPTCPPPSSWSIAGELSVMSIPKMIILPDPYLLLWQPDRYDFIH